MRVIGGEDAGRRLKAFKGSGIRPTPDRVREAVFAALGGRVRGARVLDLFAGTGALGIEALSRGAREAVFVDSSSRAVALVHENLGTVGRAGQARVIRSEAHQAVRGGLEGAFDLIFADPPYRIETKYLQGIVLAILGKGLLGPEGTLVLEGPARREAVPLAKDIKLYKRKIYGDTEIGFYGWERPEAGEGGATSPT